MNLIKNNSNSVDFNIPNKLLYNLHSQRRSGEFCDVRFCIADTVCSVHSCVLASFSPYLQHLFAHILSSGSFNSFGSCKTEQNMNCRIWSMKNPIQIHVKCKEASNNALCSECLLKVIDFMYVGKIHIQKEHLNHIQQLGKILEISELLLICDKFLKNNKGKVMKSLGLVKTVDTIVKISLHINITSDVPFESKDSEEVLGDSVKEPELSTVTSNSKPAENILIDKASSSKDRDQINDSGGSLGKMPVTLRTSGLIPKKSKQATNSDPYMCSKCSLHFANMSLLRQHRQQAHCGRLYTCYTCRFSARKAYSLFKHLQTANHNESVCSLCMFEASSAAELNIHIQQHNHPKPFFCDVCNARFPTRASANLHYPTHSTEAPYSCTICEKSFKWKHGLQNHMVVHGTEKKHLCAQCGFSTRHLSTFHTHELLHTSPLLKCPTPGCTFQTAIKKYLSSHLLTHNKEKSYQCEICGCAFSQAKNLYRHAEKHDTTAFAEKCHLCLYQTTRVDKLVTHFKKHHPEGDLQELVAKRKKRKSEYLRNKTSSTFKANSVINSRTLSSKNTKNSSLKCVNSESADQDSMKSSLVSMENACATGSLILDSGTGCQDIIIVTTMPTGALLPEDGSVSYEVGDAINSLQFAEDTIVVDNIHEQEISLVPVGDPSSVLLQSADDVHNLCLALPFQQLGQQGVAACEFQGLLDPDTAHVAPGVVEILAMPGDQMQSNCVEDGLQHEQDLAPVKDTAACVTLPGVIPTEYTDLLENLERDSMNEGISATSESSPSAILDASKVVSFCQQDIIADINETESNFFSDLTEIVSDKNLVDIADDGSFVTSDVGLLSSNADDVHLDASSSIFNGLQELPWFE